MARNEQVGRREFMKVSAAGTAGLLASSKTSASFAKAGAWSTGMQINPSVENLRVVCMHDPEMVTGDPQAFNADGYNAVVDSDRVHANLDLSAMVLTQAESPGSAWRALLRKPSGKSWNEVRVAFKVNGIERKNTTRTAVLDKMCRVVHGLGVPYENITIYDGCHNASGKVDTSGIPQGVAVSNKNSLMGGTKDAPVPTPFEGNYTCTADIADGTVDILINFPVNKNHSNSVGGATLSLKNHFGTFTPHPDGHGNLDYVIGINKSSAILGGDPPRQQLIVLDSLFAMLDGPTSNIQDNYVRNDRLVLGTFGPAVDYLVCKKIRRDILDRSDRSTARAAQQRFLTEFGYSEEVMSDLESKTPDENNGLGWVEITPDTGRRSTVPGKRTDGRTLSFSMAGSDTTEIRFALNDYRAGMIRIIDSRGRMVRSLELTGSERNVFWDGRNSSGEKVPAGMYIVLLRAGDRIDGSVLRVL